MKCRFRSLIASVVFAFLFLPARPLPAADPPAVTTTPADKETPAQHDARMKWWREARFGMFIHWGLYAVPAGTWKGKRIGGIGEWIMHNARIPVDEYAALAKQFNPVEFNADEWVRIAKDAGMKYMVITSKHHDGFCMFDTDVDDYNIHDATPFRRDPVAELAAACRRQGLRFGCYYSQSQDWHHPGGAAAGGHWDPRQDGDYDRYLRTVAMPQVREVLTRYQPAILWWDTPKDMTKKRAEQFLPLLRLRPGIIMNNRLGGGFRGDYSTPEQRIPATGLHYDWETCMTMNGTWGYKSYDDHWKSTTTLIRNLVDIASKGGNYLLNVGPTAAGVIPAPSVERLREIGAWMKMNGESIYGTSAGVFSRGLPWGRCTTRRLPDRTILYLHVFRWPKTGTLRLPGLTNKVLAAAFLEGKTKKDDIRVKQDPAGVTLQLAGQARNPHDTVIALTTAGKVEVIYIPFKPDAGGVFHLHARDAVIHGRDLHYERNKRRGLDNLGFWVTPGDWAEWPIEVKAPGEYAVTLVVATPGDNIGLVVQGGAARLEAVVRRTGAYNKFQRQKLGRIRLDAAGKTSIQARCGKAWRPINLQSLILEPVSR